MQQNNITYTTQLNNLGICCIVLDRYNQEYIQALKNDGFKYYSITKQWSKPGFNSLDKFNNYLIALFNNDTKMLKKLKPNKDDLKNDIKKLAAIKYQTKKHYINNQNALKIAELEKIFDKGTAELICQFCIKNKLDFWSISESTAKDLIIKNNDLLNDIIDFNKTNNINNCNWINDVYNDGLPF